MPPWEWRVAPPNRLPAEFSTVLPAIHDPLSPSRSAPTHLLSALRLMDLYRRFFVSQSRFGSCVL